MQIKTPPKEASKPSRPERLGDYELLAELARDPIGNVSAARSVSGQGAYDVVDVVALRSIQPSSYIDAWLVEDICQAAWGVKGQILSHVLPVTDVIVSDGRVGVVSDYSEGEYLRSLLRLAGTRRMPFPVGVALRITVDVLMGLNSIQQAIGRKPELAKLLCGGLTADRLLVGSSGEAEVAEVVLSGKVTAKPLLGHDDDALGYRAPEHFAPDGDPDVRADLFVVGILLWEMLANRSLFMTGDLKGQAARGFDAPTVQAVLKGPIEKLSGSSIPSALAEVVERALDRDVAARFQTPQQFKEAIETAAKSHLGTTADVARFVEQVAGQVLASRKALIHRALRLSDPGGMVASPAGAIKVVMPDGGKPDDAPPSSKSGSKESPKPPAAADKQESPKPGAAAAKTEERKSDAKPGAGKIVRPGAGGPPRPKATLLGMPAVDPAVAKAVKDEKAAAKDDKAAAKDEKAAAKDDKAAAKDDKAAAKDDKAAAKDDKAAAKDDKSTSKDEKAASKDKDKADVKNVFGAGGVSAWDEPKITEADEQGGEHEGGREALSTMDLEEVEAAAAFSPSPIKLPDGDGADEKVVESLSKDDLEIETEPAEQADKAEKPEPKKKVVAAEPEPEELQPKKSKTMLWAGVGVAALLVLVVVIVATRGGSTADVTPPASASASPTAIAASASAAATETATAAATATQSAEPVATASATASAQPEATAAATTTPAKETKGTTGTQTTKSTAPVATSTAAKKTGGSKTGSKKALPKGI